MASCSPVEAPLGTAARPRMPLSKTTSTSTVGLPRESSISRPCTATIVDILLSLKFSDSITAAISSFADQMLFDRFNLDQIRRTWSTGWQAGSNYHQITRLYDTRRQRNLFT